MTRSPRVDSVCRFFPETASNLHRPVRLALTIGFGLMSTPNLHTVNSAPDCAISWTSWSRATWRRGSLIWPSPSAVQAGGTARWWSPRISPHTSRRRGCRRPWTIETWSVDSGSSLTSQAPPRDAQTGPRVAPEPSRLRKLDGPAPGWASTDARAEGGPSQRGTSDTSPSGLAVGQGPSPERDRGARRDRGDRRAGLAPPFAHP